ncbi:FAD-binding protein [Eggerthellaceae bacterium zg-1084]|uniref:NAD(P)/FAD-dependent oxidoreductase n=1 Tax=Berryella wangjianweii TaxID=2734634 RepID=UPI001551D7F1|nr:FAD-binding protein [Berryella wangjianweii]NPD30800.1 FAD-binding protein [Berryella wangjianweii]
MIRVENVRLPLDAGLPDSGCLVTRAAARALGVDAGTVAHARLLRRSVDARKRSDVHFTATLAVGLSDPALERRALEGETGCARGVRVAPYEPAAPLRVPDLRCASARPPRPIVVGAGPSGLFAALYLAEAGMRPLLVEQGQPVEQRVRAVERFNRGGQLDPFSNIQFGEGGAGTFSDGKLTTGTKSPLARHVLRWLVDAGAPAEILWQAKPHVGTDRLVEVVRRLRERIVACGGEVRFDTQLSDLRLHEGRLTAAVLRNVRTEACEQVPAAQLVLACGHSARDTFQLMRNAGARMERKAFSLGVRIEHPQGLIDRAQYGAACAHPALGAADYKLVAHLPSGRNVYTFCMCPGGEVVCAASEQGGVVVNGMSRFARDTGQANSALLVGVGPGDFGSDDVLAGIDLQRRIERAAFACARKAGGDAYQAPAQTVGDFLSGRCGRASAAVRPSYARGVVWADLRACLPAFVCDALAEGLRALDGRLRGFADPQAVMIGVETRSSSPVRVLRGASMQASFVAAASQGAAGAADALDFSEPDALTSGVYPSGEGPGYAGGIMSAAVDGLRVAEACLRHAAAQAGVSLAALPTRACGESADENATSQGARGHRAPERASTADGRGKGSAT